MLALLPNWLIKPKYNKPDSSSSGSQAFIEKAKSAILRNVSLNTFSYSIAIFSVIGLMVTSPAYAGIFSSIFETENFSKNSNINSQNIELLAAPLSVNPFDGKGGAIVVIENEALKSEGGPLNATDGVGDARPEASQIAVYVVREGDTLGHIAELFDVSVNTIRWANDINSKGTIQPGQKLTILPVSGIQYEIEKGDTLSKIAEAYEADVQEILDFNIIASESELSVGDTIIIPGADLGHSENSAPAGPARVVTSSASSGFILPLKGTITQGPHGPRRAIDIAAPYGTPVVAACSGSVPVAKIGYNGGYGTMAVQDCDNGRQIIYAHFSSLGIGPGEYAPQGRVIGYVGSTGRSTGNHLHVEGISGVYGY